LSYQGPVLAYEKSILDAIEAARVANDTKQYNKLVAQNPFKKSPVREWAEAIIFAVFAATFIRMFLIEAFVIPTSSMEGSLVVGDFLFVSKGHYGIRMPQTIAMLPNRKTVSILPIMLLESLFTYNNKPVKLKKMKNFEATRGKIKMYLNALKERYSTVEWREYHANKICKEFQVSVLLPQLLKNEGYYHYEHKGVPSMMLSEKIVMLSEVSAHNKIREFCKESNERKSVRNLQNKEKDKLNKKRLDAKAVNKAKKEVYLQNQFNFTNRGFGQEGYKTLSIKVGRNFYKNEMTKT
jgi:signal peptidase I